MDDDVAMRLVTAMQAMTAGFRHLADMIPAAQTLKMHADMADQHLAAVKEAMMPPPEPAPEKVEAAEEELPAEDLPAEEDAAPAR